MTSARAWRTRLVTPVALAVLVTAICAAVARAASPPVSLAPEADVRRHIDEVFAEWDRWDSPGAAVV